MYFCNFVSAFDNVYIQLKEKYKSFKNENKNFSFGSSLESISSLLIKKIACILSVGQL